MVGIDGFLPAFTHALVPKAHSTKAHRRTARGHTVTRSHSHTGTQSHRHTVTHSHSHTGTQAHSHTVTHTVTRSHVLNLCIPMCLPYPCLSYASMSSICGVLLWAYLGDVAINKMIVLSS